MGEQRRKGVLIVPEKAAEDVSCALGINDLAIARSWLLTAFGNELDLISMVHTCLLSESEGFFFFFGWLLLFLLF